jgi:hypothetical protein
MPAAPLQTTNSDTNAYQLESGQITPTTGKSDAGSLTTEGTSRAQRWRETLAYDPFKQERSIERYDAWRARARDERRQKIKKALIGTTDKARSVLGLGAKQQPENQSKEVLAT